MGPNVSIDIDKHTADVLQVRAAELGVRIGDAFPQHERSSADVEVRSSKCIATGITSAVWLPRSVMLWMTWPELAGTALNIEAMPRRQFLPNAVLLQVAIHERELPVDEEHTAVPGHPRRGSSSASTFSHA
jgi:hypothetical protein